MALPRTRVAAVAAFLVVLFFASPASQGAKRASVDTPPQHWSESPHPRQNGGPISKKFTLLGHSDLGGGIDFGDVWGHGGYAYVGTRCGSQLLGGGGVRVVDISDPTQPKLVSKLQNPQYTRAEDAEVRDVSTATFTGALAVVGIQQCFGSGHTDVFTGMMFFDVSDPTKPKKLSKWGLPTGSIGCHEIDFVQRSSDGKVLAGCARNLVDQLNRDSPGLHIVNATNPAQPKEISMYSLGVPVGEGVGCTPLQFDHSVRFEDAGQTLYGSYWDAGTVRLDVSNASNPKDTATTKISPPDEDGDQHSMTSANGGKWLIINPEDFSPEDCPNDSRWGG